MSETGTYFNYTLHGGIHDPVQYLSCGGNGGGLLVDTEKGLVLGFVGRGPYYTHLAGNSEHIPVQPIPKDEILRSDIRRALMPLGRDLSFFEPKAAAY